MFAYDTSFADQLVCVNVMSDSSCCGGEFESACVLPCDIFEGFVYGAATVESLPGWYSNAS